MAAPSFRSALYLIYTAKTAISLPPRGKKFGPGRLPGPSCMGKRDYRPRLWTSMGMALSKFTPYQLALGSFVVSRMDSRV